MLVHLGAGNVGEIEHFAGMQHGGGERAQFGTGHSADEHSHQPGRHLIVGDLVVGVGADEEADLVGGKFAAIAFLADEVERAHAWLRLAGS